MTSSNGNIFRVTGHLCGEFTGYQWIPRTKASDAELWCFLWSAPWINGLINNREASDLRSYRAHYDVIVMYAVLWPTQSKSHTQWHYNSVTWASWRLRSPVTRLFVQQNVEANNKGNIKAPHCWVSKNDCTKMQICFMFPQYNSTCNGIKGKYIP